MKYRRVTITRRVYFNDQTTIFLWPGWLNMIVFFLVSLTCVLFICIPLHTYILYNDTSWRWLPFQGDVIIMMLMKKHQIEVDNHHMRSIRYIVLALVPIIVANKNPTALFWQLRKRKYTHIYLPISH